MNKERRRSYVYRRAFKLDTSGYHLDYLTIENTIIAEGYPEARGWLDQQAIRDDLRQAHQYARQKKQIR